MTLATSPEASFDSIEQATLEPAVEVPAKQRFAWSKIIGPAVLLVLFVAFWHYMHTNGMRYWFDKPGTLVPAPETVIDRSFVNPLARDFLLTGVKWTAIVALGGLAITIVVGMVLAILMAQARWVENSAYPYLVALQATPVLSIVPLIYAMFGGGLIPRLSVCIMISIFPIVTNTLFGMKSVDAGQLDLFKLRGASRLTRLFKLQLPAALPAIFTGFRISAGLSVIGAVVGEQFFRQGSKPGIGIVMDVYRQRGNYPQLYGGLLVIAALGITVFLFFSWLSNRVVGHWHDSGNKT